MERPQIRVRIEDRTLDINGKNLDLDESLFYAGVSRILNRDREIALELKYQNRNEEFLYEESERIFGFLGQEGLRDRIEVNPCPEGSDFPTIALTGDYGASVYR